MVVSDAHADVKGRALGRVSICNHPGGACGCGVGARIPHAAVSVLIILGDGTASEKERQQPGPGAGARPGDADTRSTTLSYSPTARPSASKGVSPPSPPSGGPCRPLSSPSFSARLKPSTSASPRMHATSAPSLPTPSPESPGFAAHSSVGNVRDCTLTVLSGLREIGPIESGYLFRSQQAGPLRIVLGGGGRCRLAPKNGPSSGDEGKGKRRVDWKRTRHESDDGPRSADSAELGGGACTMERACEDGDGTAEQGVQLPKLGHQHAGSLRTG
jgi:hypothetical protein